MSRFATLCLLTTLLAGIVIVFGAYVRLSNAGLSCPDWPGCYGALVVQDAADDVAAANAAYPDRPLDVARAWKEMIHRYLAGMLGLAILAIAVFAFARRRVPGQARVLPYALVVLVLFQAALGMWTVTLLLKPIVVTAHLLGGFATIFLLWWLTLRQSQILAPAADDDRTSFAFRPWVMGGIAVVVAQVFLGGWTSTNYAALACPDFPTCQGELLPTLTLADALKPWRGLGVDYEGGVLDNAGRVTVHVLHRLGALVTFAYVALLCLAVLRAHALPARLKRVAMFTIGVLCLQIVLGISNVVLSLPLTVAVAHNACAALLLLSLLSMYHVALPERLMRPVREPTQRIRAAT